MIRRAALAALVVLALATMGAVADATVLCATKAGAVMARARCEDGEKSLVVQCTQEMTNKASAVTGDELCKAKGDFCLMPLLSNAPEKGQAEWEKCSEPVRKPGVLVCCSFE